MSKSEQNLLNFEIKMFSLTYYFGVSQPTLGYYWEDNLTHTILMTAFFFISDPKITGSLVKRCVPKPVERLVEVDQESSNSYVLPLPSRQLSPNLCMSFNFSCMLFNLSEVSYIYLLDAWKAIGCHSYSLFRINVKRPRPDLERLNFSD